MTFKILDLHGNLQCDQGRLTSVFFVTSITGGTFTSPSFTSRAHCIVGKFVVSIDRFFCANDHIPCH